MLSERLIPAIAALLLTIELGCGGGEGFRQHAVILKWASSESTVIGYNVYRSNQHGGPYSPIRSLWAMTHYTDSAVEAGYGYYYVVTAVSPEGVESAPSNEAYAVVPMP